MTHPKPILADSQATASNVLLASQLADAITTRAFLYKENTFERDPLAKPFVHSNASALVGVVLSNLVARLVFRKTPIIERILTGVEGVVIMNNLRVLSK